MSSAGLVQTNGWHRSFQPSMNRMMAATRSLTLVNVPRLMAAGDDAEEHLDHIQSRAGGRGEMQRDAGMLASQALMSPCLWVW
jgi:hypothetical protein